MQCDSAIYVKGPLPNPAPIRLEDIRPILSTRLRTVQQEILWVRQEFEALKVKASALGMEKSELERVLGVDKSRSCR